MNSQEFNTANEGEAGQSEPQIKDTQEYIEHLRGAEQMGFKLDRSEFFRYPGDIEALKGFAEEKFSQGEKISLLELGIANLQEPMSYLAVLEDAARKYGKSLAEAVDLKMVDILPRDQIKPRFGLGKDMFLAKPIKPPKGLENSFTVGENGEYEFKPEIQDYLSEVLDDKAKTHLETPVENFVTTNQEQFDVVACNNVLQHLGGVEYESPFKRQFAESGDFSKFNSVAESILGKVKPGGVIFIHVDSGKGNDRRGGNADKLLLGLPGFADNFEQIREGTFRRKDERQKSEDREVAPDAPRHTDEEKQKIEQLRRELQGN